MSMLVSKLSVQNLESGVENTSQNIRGSVNARVQ